MEAINPSTLRSRRRRAKMTANERTRERSHYASKRRSDLIIELAPDLRCAECDEQQCHTSQLEVDHCNGREWLVDEVSPHVRYARYWREYESGVPMRALCSPCNGTDGGSRRYGYRRGRR